MYGWLWAHLPGPTPVRVILAVILFLVVVLVLFLSVFPWVESQIQYDNTQVPTSQENEGVTP